MMMMESIIWVSASIGGNQMQKSLKNLQKKKKIFPNHFKKKERKKLINAASD